MAEAPATYPSPVKQTAQQDHERTLKLLGLDSIPAGIPGSKANTDESIANPYPNLPDPLVMSDGEKVTTPEMWWHRRRPELLEIFQLEIFGRRPENLPNVTWQVQSQTDDGKTITKKLIGHVDNSSYPAISVNMQVTLVTPSNARGPVPVILQLFAPFRFRRPPTRPATFPALPPGPDWKQQVLAKAWGYAMLDTSTVQADNGAGLTSGIIGLCNKGQPRGLHDWGALSAWAWGASRTLDYFQSDPAVNARQVGLEGHSRWGKDALLAMALDPRFAIAYVSSSGEGGAKLWRRNFGEPLENVTGVNEYHWMAGNLLKYAGHVNDLPIDSHELIALCAPRPLLITGGITSGDGWADARGMFMAEVAAGRVYRLLGAKDLGTDQMPPVNTGLVDGDLAFRQHNGGHTDALNWPTFIQFASRYFSK